MTNYMFLQKNQKIGLNVVIPPIYTSMVVVA